MNGADAVIAAARDLGIKICFANPGTTEMPLVLALDRVPGVRGVLCLHENVATGAADGYARMTGEPAMCLLHLGPGLANGLTNLHNARRARVPVLNVIGEHASWHIPADPLLNSEIERLTAWFKCEAVRVGEAGDAGRSIAGAIAAARADRAILTVIVPHDVQLAEAAGASWPTGAAAPPRAFPAPNIGAAVKALRGERPAIVLGGDALTERGLRLAGRIAAAAGATLYCDTFFARMERGGDLPRVKKLPYFPDMALDLMKQHAQVVIAGTRRPVTFFGYPGVPSHLTSEAQTVMLAAPDEDVMGALAELADEIGAPEDFSVSPGARPDPPEGRLDAASVSAIIARLQPGNCIMMDEALTVGVPYFEASQSAPRFTHMMLTGGAIGQGPSTAAGAAFACPDRKVINFQSDGCGAYSVQALWTEARENLDVVTIIGANRSYNILNVELARAGITEPGRNTRHMAMLDAPYLDWVRIGEGFGVPGVSVDTAEALALELEKALAAKGPRLIEAVMD